MYAGAIWPGSLGLSSQVFFVNAATIHSSHRPLNDGVTSSLTGAEANASGRLRQAAEACADLLILVDKNLRVVFANRGSDGRASQELCGLSVVDLFPPDYRERAAQCMSGVLQIGTPDRFEFEMLGPRGTPRHIEMRVAPVFEQQQIVALTLNGSDTTQHVLAQR